MKIIILLSTFVTSTSFAICPKLTLKCEDVSVRVDTGSSEGNKLFETVNYPIETIEEMPWYKQDDVRRLVKNSGMEGNCFGYAEPMQSYFGLIGAVIVNENLNICSRIQNVRENAGFVCTKIALDQPITLHIMDRKNYACSVTTSL
jgi:hypothetical protein